MYQPLYCLFIVVILIHTLSSIILPVFEIQKHDAYMYVLVDAMKTISLRIKNIYIWNTMKQKGPQIINYIHLTFSIEPYIMGLPNLRVPQLI